MAVHILIVRNRAHRICRCDGADCAAVSPFPVEAAITLAFWPSGPLALWGTAASERPLAGNTIPQQIIDGFGVFCTH